MSSSKLRLVRRTSLFRRIRRRRIRLTQSDLNLLRPLNGCEWLPPLMMNFIVTSMETLCHKNHSRLWIDPVKVILEKDYFDLKLSPHRPIENTQRSFDFPQLDDAENYSVERWNFSALGGILDKYLGFSTAGKRGKRLKRKYFIHILCLHSMKSVIDGFLESFVKAKDPSIGYVECYEILQRLNLQIREFGICPLYRCSSPGTTTYY